MAVTTTLLGKLGGEVETVTVSIPSFASPQKIPDGWKKAVGVLEATNVPKEGGYRIVFGNRITLAEKADTLTGGGVVSEGEFAQFYLVTGTLTWYRLE